MNVIEELYRIIEKINQQRPDFPKGFTVHIGQETQMAIMRDHGRHMRPHTHGGIFEVMGLPVVEDAEPSALYITAPHGQRYE